MIQGRDKIEQLNHPDTQEAHHTHHYRDPCSMSNKDGIPHSNCKVVSSFLQR